MPTHMEKTVSRAMGAAKKAKGTVQGLTGVFKTLMEEHGEVGALLMRVRSSKDLQTRARLWGTIRQELLAHEKGELAVVYPMYMQHPAIEPLAVEHNTQASELAALIEIIDDTGLDDRQWTTRFDRLVKLVEKHVHQEESEIFPAGQRVFGGHTDALEKEYLQFKRTLLNQV